MSRAETNEDARMCLPTDENLDLLFSTLLRDNLNERC